MRKLIFAFIFIILLTGCTANNVSNSESNAQSIIVEAQEDNLDIFRQLAEEIEIEDILGGEKLKSLKVEGISVAIKSCEVISYAEAETVIEFVKGEHNLCIDTVMDIYYFGDSTNPQNFQLGGFNVTVDETRLIFTQNCGITKYTLDTLEYINEITVFKDTFRLIDTVPFNVGYMSLATNGSGAVLITFNEDGQVKGRIEIDDDVFRSVIRRNGYYKQKLAVAPQPQLMLFNNSELLFISSNVITEKTSFVYNSDLYHLYKPYLRTYLNDSKGEIYILDADDRYASVYIMKDGKPIQQMRFRKSELLDEMWGKKGVIPKQWDENNEIITLVCNSTGIELVFDFKNKKIWTGDTSKAVIENNLEDKISDSPDGRYSLWWADGGSGGDVMVMDLYLVENKTGTAKYLDTIGGMYGGNADCGFFSNGDIYTIMLDEFKVFNIDMSQQDPIFKMSKNFPLGDNAVGQGTYRDLLSARRDPVTHSWTVLYNEYESCEWYKDYFVDYDKFSDNFYKSTYKVGILDPQGNLTKVYDTGEYVMSYSFRQVKMHMEAGDILYFSVLFKGYEPQLEGKIDLKTGEYTNISGGYNDWK